MSALKPVMTVLAAIGGIWAGFFSLSLYLSSRGKVLEVVESAGRPEPPALPDYVPNPIGAPVSDFGRPWVTNVQIVDLDQDGMLDVLYCEGQKNSVRWIQQSPRGKFIEYIIGEDIPGPAHVWAADINGSGRLDILVASMGMILPTNDRIGAVVVLENLDNRQFRKRVLVDRIPRVTDVRAANLSEHKDGRLDLMVGQFGYNQGETSWLENKGDWRFERRIINTQSGCVHTPVADFDGDGKMDFATLISQEWEEVHIFKNLGGGQFQASVCWGSTNEDFGSSGMNVADINRDGRPDLLFSNGDMFDYTVSGQRLWHGVQWLENKGEGNFICHRIGSLPVAFGACAADLNGDGLTDIVAVSAFADNESPDTVSLMAWINTGREVFVPVVLAHTPTHLITAAVGDLDGNGIPVIVTGGFHAWPRWDHMSNVTLWRKK